MFFFTNSVTDAKYLSYNFSVQY